MTNLQFAITLFSGLIIAVGAVWKTAKALENGLKALGGLLAAPIEKAVTASAENEKRFLAIEQKAEQERHDKNAEIARLEKSQEELKTLLKDLIKRVDEVFTIVAAK